VIVEEENGLRGRVCCLVARDERGWCLEGEDLFLRGWGGVLCGEWLEAVFLVNIVLRYA